MIYCERVSQVEKDGWTARVGVVFNPDQKGTAVTFEKNCVEEKHQGLFTSIHLFTHNSFN
jgi:hypothetical protein